MANYPCPVCGASHKYPPDKCRLCGQQMTEDAVVGDFEGSRSVVKEKKGVMGIALIVAACVGVLVLAAVLIGVLPGREGITGVASNVPGLSDSEKSGWVALDDEEGGFRVELPSETPESETVVLALPVGESDGTQWRAWIGTDGLTEVTYVKGGLPAGEREYDAVRAIADQWEADFENEPSATVDSITETTAFGHPAVQLEARNVDLEEQPGNDYHQRTIAFFNDGTLYLLTEYTTNPKTDAFNYMLSTFGLKSPAAVAGGEETTTTAAGA